MRKLMNILMLTCKKATFFIAVRDLKKLNIINRFQLMLHLMVCPFCHEFDVQNKMVNKGIDKLYKDSQYLSPKNLSEDKKSILKNTVNQIISK